MAREATLHRSSAAGHSADMFYVDGRGLYRTQLGTSRFFFLPVLILLFLLVSGECVLTSPESVPGFVMAHSLLDFVWTAVRGRGDDAQSYCA